MNAQRSTLNAQRSTLNAQRSTLNAQRSTLIFQVVLGFVGSGLILSQVPFSVRGTGGQPRSVPIPSTNGEYAHSLDFSLPPIIFDSVSESRITRTFAVKNDTSSAVEFTQVRPSCGCALAKLERNLVQPHEETSLAVDLVPQGFFGNKAFSVVLETNKPAKPWLVSFRFASYPKNRRVFAGERIHKIPLLQSASVDVEVECHAAKASELPNSPRFAVARGDLEIIAQRSTDSVKDGDVPCRRFTVTARIQPQPSRG